MLTYVKNEDKDIPYININFKYSDTIDVTCDAYLADINGKNIWLRFNARNIEDSIEEFRNSYYLVDVKKIIKFCQIFFQKSFELNLNDLLGSAYSDLKSANFRQFIFDQSFNFKFLLKLQQILDKQFLQILNRLLSKQKPDFFTEVRYDPHSILGFKVILHFNAKKKKRKTKRVINA